MARRRRPDPWRSFASGASAVPRGAASTRRDFLRGLSLTAAALAVGCRSLGDLVRASSEVGVSGTVGTTGGKPVFLVVVGAMGGASLVDSFLPVRESESADAPNVNAYPDAMVKDIAASPIRALNFRGGVNLGVPTPFTTDIETFVKAHKDDMMVVTATTSSVNHPVAQKRALTGGGAWNGRTLQELVALAYGEGLPLPNVNMSTFGYAERGADASLPAWAYGESVAAPFLFPFGLHGSKGIKNAPSQSLLNLARDVRDAELDPESVFFRTFGQGNKLSRWVEQRAASRALEEADLITNANFVDERPGNPLSEYGLAASPSGDVVRAAYPNFFDDPLEAQCALAFLLLKYRASASVTISPSFNLLRPGGGGFENINLPLAFDFGHVQHRAGQAWMWKRVLTMVDRLIALLAAEPFDMTESLWDRTVIYVATDFGRSKTRRGRAVEYSSGHDLNNGFLVLSPLVKGNTVLGGVNPDTLLTHGFDLSTGAADAARTTSEGEFFAGLLQAMGIVTPAGMPDVPAMRP